mgnify:CR=1 FL=1
MGKVVASCTRCKKLLEFGDFAIPIGSDYLCWECARKDHRTPVYYPKHGAISGSGLGSGRMI